MENPIDKLNGIQPNFDFEDIIELPIESVPDELKALMYCAYVTLFPCFPCMQALEKTSVQWIKVKGFSHKGATGNVILYDPEFFA